VLPGGAGVARPGRVRGCQTFPLDSPGCGLAACGGSAGSVRRAWCFPERPSRLEAGPSADGPCEPNRLGPPARHPGRSTHPQRWCAARVDARQPKAPGARRFPGSTPHTLLGGDLSRRTSGVASPIDQPLSAWEIEPIPAEQSPTCERAVLECPWPPSRLHGLGHAGGTRWRSPEACITSLEEGSPQGWGVLVVLADLPPAAPSNPSRSAPCRTRVAREDHDGPSSPGRCLRVRSSPSAAPLLTISRVSGVV